MGKRIQKLKAKQPRAIRINNKERVKKYHKMLEVSINGKCINSVLIVGFGGTRIRQMVHAINNESKDLEISFEISQIPNNPAIDRIAEKLLDNFKNNVKV